MTLALTTAAAAPLTTPDPAGRSNGPWAGTWLTATSATTSIGTPLKDVRTIIGAGAGTAATLTGAGIGIALLDTGVAPVPGLPSAQIVNGPDLSIESQSPALRYLDTYGHGTHMAGIIVGNDAATGTVGLAPKAKLTSVKLGTANGAVDVTQVMAAIDWVVQNRNNDPANPIRVITLAYGSGGTPAAWSDPLQYAVEQAWKAGIVVVVSAGNAGNSTTKLTNPASDPFVLSAGSTSTKGTLATADDEVSTFTNLTGANTWPIAALAPGESILSLRNPGSMIDNQFPAARAGDTLFRGSGTSQAAAVVSAAVALLLQARPALTPDQVKDVLKRGTYVPGLASPLGMRQINLATALTLRPSTTATQTHYNALGTGQLDAARGDSRVVNQDTELAGQQTLFGPFDGRAWIAASASRTAWKGGTWMGYRMAGDGWNGTSFASRTWASATWPTPPWAGDATWVDPAWEGRFWAGRFWAATDWQGRFWASDDWAGGIWQ